MAQVLPSTSPARLTRDQRGAILVPALVMGALMTGALFYVAAVGDAIMFRTELQNAADITAFKSAVWHARGMNTIAIMNALMMFALAIFAVVRLAEIVLFLLGLIPILAFLSPMATSLVNAEPTLHRFINTALNAIQVGEEAVSAAVPYVAFGDAKATPTAADTIWPLSLSLIPPAAEMLAQSAPRRPQQFLSALPIQEGDFGLLCGRATAMVPRQIAAVLERAPLGWFSDRVSDFADVLFDDVLVSVVSRGDGIFCQPINGMIASLLTMAGESACDQVQNNDDEVEDEQAARDEQARRQSGQNGSSPQTVDNGNSSGRDGRRRHDGSAREPIDCAAQVANATGGAANTLRFTAVPSIVWEPAMNGNFAMHTWTWAKGRPRLFEPTQQGIAIADKGRRPAVTPNDGATAMAEYYFDCDKSWHDHCKKDALWAANWTARMRRFRSPVEEFQTVGLNTVEEFLSTLQQSVGEHAEEFVGDAINRLTGVSADNAVARWVGARVESIPLVHALSERIDQVVGDLRNASGIDRLIDPRRYGDQEKIH